MKIRSNFALFSSLALIAATPVAFAKGGGGHGKHTKSIETEIVVSDKSAAVDWLIKKDDAATDNSDEGNASDPSDTGNDTADSGDSGTDETVTNGGDTQDHGGAANDDGSADGTTPNVSDSAGGDGEVTTVPIDWVKRGGEGNLENPDVIFYNMAGGLPTVTKAEAPVAVSKVTGQDEKGTAIEAAGGSASPQIKREKKAPVALVKKGRIFLR